MLQLLKDARELAMDGGSAGEKSAIFNQFKGKINNYLTTQGHNVSQAYKDWGARQKARAATKKPLNARTPSAGREAPQGNAWSGSTSTQSHGTDH